MFNFNQGHTLSLAGGGSSSTNELVNTSLKSRNSHNLVDNYLSNGMNKRDEQVDF